MGTLPGSRASPLSAFLLGLWVGGSVFLVAVATYNFVGIGPSMEANGKLAARAGFDPNDDAARKTSVIWVFSSELNRKYFSSWNTVQLLLGSLTLVVVLLRSRRPIAILTTALALVIVGVLAFYLSPQIVTLGRSLDFVPRIPEPAGLAEFQTLHRTYTILEMAKLFLLLLGVLLVIRGAGPQGGARNDAVGTA